MKEIHPFEPFVPKAAKYLILGTFPPVNWSSYGDEAWFYPSTRNQFWKILEAVYNVPLKFKNEKEKLLTEKKIAISDVFLEATRKDNNSSDTNLIDLTFNSQNILKILKTNKISKIYFTSKLAVKTFHTISKLEKMDLTIYELITLPSPSPRYASMPIKEKIRVYKMQLPK